MDVYLSSERKNKMNDKLRPCPFCGVKSTDVGFINHKANCYLMRKYMGDTKKNLLISWNTHPLEDELLEVLKHFVNSDWTSDEEYFETVTIGKAAIIKAEGKD
jgi:hypothetical protein